METEEAKCSESSRPFLPVRPFCAFLNFSTRRTSWPYMALHDLTRLRGEAHREGRIGRTRESGNESRALERANRSVTNASVFVILRHRSKGWHLRAFAWSLSSWPWLRAEVVLLLDIYGPAMRWRFGGRDMKIAPTPAHRSHKHRNGHHGHHETPVPCMGARSELPEFTCQIFQLFPGPSSTAAKESDEAVGMGVAHKLLNFSQVLPKM